MQGPKLAAACRSLLKLQLQITPLRSNARCCGRARAEAIDTSHRLFLCCREGHPSTFEFFPVWKASSAAYAFSRTSRISSGIGVDLNRALSTQTTVT